MQRVAAPNIFWGGPIWLDLGGGGPRAPIFGQNSSARGWLFPCFSRLPRFGFRVRGITFWNVFGTLVVQIWLDLGGGGPGAPMFGQNSSARGWPFPCFSRLPRFGFRVRGLTLWNVFGTGRLRTLERSHSNKQL